MGEAGPLLTRSLRVVELVDGVNECRAESPLVDQMELPKGVVVDHGLRVFPKIDCNGKQKILECYRKPWFSHIFKGSRIPKCINQWIWLRSSI